MSDINIGRESKHKVIRLYVDKPKRAKRYMWECKICHKVSGPSEVGNILKDSIGACCANKQRQEKYRLLENSLVSTFKRLKTFEGMTADSYPHPLFIYECTFCEKEYGPNQLNQIKKYAETACCSGGKYNVRGHGEVSSYRIKLIYSVASKRNLECIVTSKYLHELWLAQNKKCWYTGDDIESIELASLDRTNSNLGYVPGNVRWVLRDINTMKWNLSEKNFLEFCSKVHNYHHNEKDKK